MNTILHKLANGGVGHYPPNSDVVSIMMATGFNWSKEQINYEASKFTIPTSEDGWGGFSAEFANEWATALGEGGLTEAQVLDLFTRRVQLRRGYTESAIVDADTLPHYITCMGDCAEADCCGRYFRDAIVWDDGVANKCTCDMDKCRDVHMDKIRLSRNAELVKEDVTFMRAVEAGDTDAQTTIATKKQTLRDIPATFDITTDVDTPEKIKAKWPAELPARE